MLLNLGIIKKPLLLGKKTFKKNFLSFSEYSNINIDSFKLRNLSICSIGFEHLEKEANVSMCDLELSFNFSKNKRNMMEDEFFLKNLYTSNESKTKLKPFPFNNENSFNILNDQDSQSLNEDFNKENQIKIGNEENLNCKSSLDDIDYFKKWNMAIFENENNLFGKGKIFMNENLKEYSYY